MADNPFRNLPAVHEVLQALPLRAVAADHAHEVLTAAVRDELAELRDRMAQGEPIDGQADADAVAGRVVERLGRELRPKLRPVINATGIVLHTNLGRAPIAEEAARAAYEAARGYLNLELDLETGKRSSRQDADPRLGLPADRGRVGHRGQQQRRRHGHRPAGPVPRARR